MHRFWFLCPSACQLSIVTHYLCQSARQKQSISCFLFGIWNLNFLESLISTASEKSFFSFQNYYSSSSHGFSHGTQDCVSYGINQVRFYAREGGISKFSRVRGTDPNYTRPLFAPNYTHFWNLNFSETIQPNSAWSSLSMCVVLILSMKEN